MPETPVSAVSSFGLDATLPGVEELPDGGVRNFATGDFYTYVHLKPDLTPFYVGKGTYSRAFDLSPKLRNEWHGRTVSKYGKENIIIEATRCVTEDEALLRERLIISALRMSGIELCNLTDGGEGISGYKRTDGEKARISAFQLGRVRSPETRAKMSAAKKGVKGSPRSAETRAKMSNAHIGHVVSAETRTKIGAANKIALTGKQQSPEIIAKRVAKLIGQVRTLEHKANISSAKKLAFAERKRIKEMSDA